MKRFRGLVIFLILFTIVGGAVVAANRATSSPDSSGITMVKEDWRAAGDGIFIRQRFYRHAKWMEEPSLFRVVPTNESGTVVGQTLIAYAGKDDTLSHGLGRFRSRQPALN